MVLWEWKYRDDGPQLGRDAMERRWSGIPSPLTVSQQRCHSNVSVWSESRMPTSKIYPAGNDMLFTFRTMWNFLKRAYIGYLDIRGSVHSFSLYVFKCLPCASIGTQQGEPRFLPLRVNILMRQDIYSHRQVAQCWVVLLF